MKIKNIAWLCLASVCMWSNGYATRIKDIANIAGVRDNQLVGYGLVVGLDGTGDRTNQAPFTDQSFHSMLAQFGVRIPAGKNMQLKNVAAVAISANLPPFARQGQKIDITISSIGNASSLRGGMLLLAPLRGADGQVYAIAQGNILVSGFGAQGSDGSKIAVNVSCSGRIPNGATVEKTIDMPFAQNGTVTFELTQPDFTTAERMALAINRRLHRKVAHAIDAGAVTVQLNAFSNGLPNPSSDYVQTIAQLENIPISPDETRAKVVVNTRTGTIVLGGDISISPVAVTHGNLSVVVSERPYVSQPQPFSKGKTVVGSASDISVNQQNNRTFLFAPGPTLKDLVAAINQVGAAPSDLMAILEAIKTEGALHADLEVI